MINNTIGRVLGKMADRFPKLSGNDLISSVDQKNMENTKKAVVIEFKKQLVLWQIIDLLPTNKSSYFSQPLPLIEIVRARRLITAGAYFWFL